MSTLLSKSTLIPDEPKIDGYSHGAHFCNSFILHSWLWRFCHRRWGNFGIFATK
jgi:hypothetical protein